MIILEKDNPFQFQLIRSSNLTRQYEFLEESIELGLPKSFMAFDKPFLWALNHLAVANLCQMGGRFRREPVMVGTHNPPPFQEVDALVDQFIAVIQQNWWILPPIRLAAYALWRLNWIHPFIDGNGRVARAACYFLLCVRARTSLPGEKTIPERIQESKDEYVQALRDADTAWANGGVDVSHLERYLIRLLSDQLANR